MLGTIVHAFAWCSCSTASYLSSCVVHAVFLGHDSDTLTCYPSTADHKYCLDLYNDPSTKKRCYANLGPAYCCCWQAAVSMVTCMLEGPPDDIMLSLCVSSYSFEKPNVAGV